MLFLGKGRYVHHVAKCPEKTKQPAVYLHTPPGKTLTKPLTAIATSFRPVSLNTVLQKAPGLKGSGDSFIFFMSVQDWGAFFNTHNVTCMPFFRVYDLKHCVNQNMVCALEAWEKSTRFCKVGFCVLLCVPCKWVCFCAWALWKNSFCSLAKNFRFAYYSYQILWISLD